VGGTRHRPLSLFLVKSLNIDIACEEFVTVGFVFIFLDKGGTAVWELIGR
jgi:hypothetical protein